MKNNITVVNGGTFSVKKNPVQEGVTPLSIYNLNSQES